MRAASNRRSSTAAAGRSNARAPNRWARACSSCGVGARIDREHRRIDGPAARGESHARRRIAGRRYDQIAAADVHLRQPFGIPLMRLPQVVRGPLGAGCRHVDESSSRGAAAGPCRSASRSRSRRSSSGMDWHFDPSGGHAGRNILRTMSLIDCLPHQPPMRLIEEIVDVQHGASATGAPCSESGRFLLSRALSRPAGRAGRDSRRAARADRRPGRGCAAARRPAGQAAAAADRRARSAEVPGGGGAGRGARGARARRRQNGSDCARSKAR